MKNRPQYRQSQIHLALKCMKAHNFRYGLNIKTPPKAAPELGSSVDATNTRNLIQKIETKTDLPESEMLEVFSQDFDIRAQNIEWGKDNAGKQKDIGVGLVKLLHKEFSPAITPFKVQENFTLITDAGYDLTGQIDYVDIVKKGRHVKHVVSDLKTSKLSYHEDAISRAIQPAIYDFAYEALFGKKADSFRYDVLVKKTTPVAQRVQAEVTAADRAWAFDTINNVHKAIEAGIDTPAPDGAWWCSADWCGYWNICKGKDRLKPITEKENRKVDEIFSVKRSKS